MTVKAITQTCYEPYRVEIVRYAIHAKNPEAVKSALAQLDAKNPMLDDAYARRLIAFLLANTKRRKEHVVSEKLLLSGLLMVARQYPKKIVEHVIGSWYKRAGDEAIFTPSQAEFYRAIEEVAQPWKVLREALLNWRQDGV